MHGSLFPSRSYLGPVKNYQTHFTSDNHIIIITVIIIIIIIVEHIENKSTIMDTARPQMKTATKEYRETDPEKETWNSGLQLQLTAHDGLYSSGSDEA